MKPKHLLVFVFLFSQESKTQTPREKPRIQFFSVPVLKVHTKENSAQSNYTIFLNQEFNIIKLIYFPDSEST